VEYGSRFLDPIGRIWSILFFIILAAWLRRPELWLGRRMEIGIFPNKAVFPFFWRLVELVLLRGIGRSLEVLSARLSWWKLGVGGKSGEVSFNKRFRGLLFWTWSCGQRFFSAGHGGEGEGRRSAVRGELVWLLAGLGGEGEYSDNIAASFFPRRHYRWIRRCCILSGFSSSSRAGALRREPGIFEPQRWILAARRCCSKIGLLRLGAVGASGCRGSSRSGVGDLLWSREANPFCSSKSKAICQPIILAMMRPSSLPARSGVQSTSSMRPSCCRGGVEEGPDCFLLICCRVLFVKRMGLVVFFLLLRSCVKICSSPVLF